MKRVWGFLFFVCKSLGEVFLNDRELQSLGNPRYSRHFLLRKIRCIGDCNPCDSFYVVFINREENLLCVW